MSAEQQQWTREESRHRHWEERRKPKQAEEWEQVVEKTQKKGKRSSETFARPYNPLPIKLLRQYEVLERCLEVEDETMYSTTTQHQSGYTVRNGMYKSMYSNSPCEEEVSSRPH